MYELDKNNKEAVWLKKRYFRYCIIPK